MSKSRVAHTLGSELPKKCKAAMSNNAHKDGKPCRAIEMRSTRSVLKVTQRPLVLELLSSKILTPILKARSRKSITQNKLSYNAREKIVKKRRLRRKIKRA